MMRARPPSLHCRIAGAASPFAAPRRLPRRCRNTASTPRNSACGRARPTTRAAALQRAIDQAARTRTPLMLAPGVYRAGGLKLPAGAQLVGVRGATRLITDRAARRCRPPRMPTPSRLSGLTLDGGGQPLPDDRGARALQHRAKACASTDCEIVSAGGNGIVLEQCDGEVTAHTITDAADNALFCNDSARPVHHRQHHPQLRQWRHPRLAKRQAPRRQHRSPTTASRTRGARRRQRPERQRHQRVSRRQRDRARQHHPQRRLLRDPRQFRLQYPDHRQQLRRARRGRDLFRVRASRAR